MLPLELEGSLLTTMNNVVSEAQAAIADIPGATVEDNKYSVSVHFRNCVHTDWNRVRISRPCLYKVASCSQSVAGQN